MLDLETMGTSLNAAIISIGAVFFDPKTGVIGADFYYAIERISSERYGVVDESTKLWWSKQSVEAQAVLSDDDAIDLKQALHLFAEWISQIENFKSRIVWGNGPSFDNVILGNAFRTLDLDCPWPHWGDRDVRTVVDMGRQLKSIDPKKSLPFDGVAHNALADAKHQARYVSAIFDALANG